MAFGLLFFVLAMLMSIPINGYVISVTWAWFIVPIFDVREISLVEAVGLAIFASVILPVRAIPNYSKENNEDDAALIVRMIGMAASQVFVAPALTLMGAWFWHTFFIFQSP